MNYATAIIYNKPWAISPSVYRSLNDVLAGYELGLSIDETEDPEQGTLDIDGVRVIDVCGVIQKQVNLITALFGGVSTNDLQEKFDAALADPSVKGIVLRIDSSGGTVDGSFSLADHIYSRRGTKPVIAFIDGAGLSAAYLIASSADKIISTDASEIGSIGVTYTRRDETKANEMQGIVNRVFTGGSHKHYGNPDTKLSDAETAATQDLINTYYELFVAKVSRNRGLDPAFVLSEQADGMVFLGDKSLEKKLIDGKGTFQNSLEAITSMEISMMNDTPIETPAAEVAKAEAVVDVVTETLAEMKAEVETVTAETEPKVDTSAIERERAARIYTACSKLGLKAEVANELIKADLTIEQALASAIDKAAQSAQPISACKDHVETPVDGNDPYGVERLAKAKAFATQNKVSLAQALSAIAKVGK